MKKIAFGEQKNVIGTRLHTLRRAAGFSQSDLAARMQTLGVHMDQQMLSKIENNDRIVTDYELACLCHLLGQDPKAFLADFFEAL